MTQKELVYVLAVAKEKSISKAAQKLFITQPSLSNAIKKIEEALGTKLFIRTNRGLKLTFSGERYCAIANDIIKIFEDFEIEISDINNLKKGRLHIGITAYISTYLLPKVLPKFKQAAPNIDFTFIELTSVELEKELKEGLIDFAIMPTAGIPDLQPDPKIKFTPFKTVEFYLVTKKNHPQSKLSVQSDSHAYPYMDLHCMKDEIFMLGSPTQRSRQVVEYILRKSDFLPAQTLTTHNYQTAKNLASEGLGVSIIPSLHLEILEGPEKNDFYAIDSALHPFMTFSVATHADGYLSKASRLFIKLVGEEVEKNNLLEEVIRSEH